MYTADLSKDYEEAVKPLSPSETKALDRAWAKLRLGDAVDGLKTLGYEVMTNDGREDGKPARQMVALLPPFAFGVSLTQTNRSLLGARSSFGCAEGFVYGDNLFMVVAPKSADSVREHLKSWINATIPEAKRLLEKKHAEAQTKPEQPKTPGL